MAECFVIMPFRPELHYMFLYLKRHIEETFPDATCERGDSEILTVPLLDKIVGYIQRADVIIADCTGRNPNVFYELGIAHAMEKPVVLITQDDILEAPTDIRAFEFIRYDVGDHRLFLDNIDRALGKHLSQDFTDLHDWTMPYVQQFAAEAQRQIQRQDAAEFNSAVAARVSRTGVPDLELDRARLLMPLLIRDSNDLDVAIALDEWIKQHFEQNQPD